MPRRECVPFPARSKVTPLGQLAALGFGEHPPEPPSIVPSCVCEEEYLVLPINPRPSLPPDSELRKQCGNSGNNAKIFSQIFKIDFPRFLAAGHMEIAEFFCLRQNRIITQKLQKPQKFSQESRRGRRRRRSCTSSSESTLPTRNSWRSD